MCFTRFRGTRGCCTMGMVLSSLVKINRRSESAVLNKRRISYRIRVRRGYREDRSENERLEGGEFISMERLGEDEGGGTNSSTVVVGASECGEVGGWGLLMRRWCTKVVVSGNFCEAFQCVCVCVCG